MRYENFRTGNVLNFVSSNGVFHAINVTIENTQIKGSYPYVVRTSQNNGIRGYIIEDESKLNPANTISFAQDTAEMFYQADPYFTGNKVKVLSVKKGSLSEEKAMFLIACLKKAFSSFAWGSSYDTKILVEVPLSLPIKIDEDGNPIIDETCFYHERGYVPDFDYMQEHIAELEQQHIAELEQERIAELEQYVVATGINDYELNDGDNEALSWFKRVCSDTPMVCSKRFKVSDLFKTQKVTSKLAKEDLMEGFGYPVYSSDTKNNGVIGYTDNPEFICDKDSPVYITFGDHTRTFNIARKSFSVLDNVKVLIPRVNNDEALLFIITEWQKQIPNLGYSRHWKVAKDCAVALPIKTDANNNPVIDTGCQYHSEGYIPNWELMAKYVRAIEKIVIGDVAKHRDVVIDITKKVVNASA